MTRNLFGVDFRLFPHSFKDESVELLNDSLAKDTVSLNAHPYRNFDCQP